MEDHALQFSTKKVSKTLLREILNALKNARPYGSIEIFVQKDVVTQITTRNIKKTSSDAIK